MKECAMPTTTYGPTTTAAEIVRDVDLHGQRVVVTGASSGIGVETAGALASTGADVTLAVRNLEAGSNVANGIADTLPSGAGALQVARLDPANGARVVSVASIGHLFSPVVFDDLHYRFRPYDRWTSYGQSKSANVLFAVGAAKRWADDGIAINALMPGNVATTALARHMGADDLANFGETTALALPPVKTIEQGDATSVLLAACSDVEKVT